MLASACASAGIDCRGPIAGISGVVSEAGDGPSEPVVAGLSKHNIPAFAGRVGDGVDAGLGGKLVLGGKAFAYIAQFS